MKKLYWAKCFENEFSWNMLSTHLAESWATVGVSKMQENYTQKTIWFGKIQMVTRDCLKAIKNDFSQSNQVGAFLP